MPGWIVTLLALAAIVAFFLWFRRSSRKNPAVFAVPAGWREVLAQRLPHLTLLEARQRAMFEQRVQEFLAGKRFVGCDGLVVTDEMRVLIAGMAGLLILREQA